MNHVTKKHHAQTLLVLQGDADLSQVLPADSRGCTYPLLIQVRGNLRAPREQVLDTVLKGVEHHFGQKYQVFLVPDPDSEEDDPKGGPR